MSDDAVISAPMAMTFGPELAMCVEAALRDAGVEPARALAATGLRPEEIRGPTLAQTALLVRTAAAASGDPDFGLHVAEKVRVTPFELAAYIAESRWTAREVLTLGAAVLLSSTDAGMRFAVDEGCAVWSVDPIEDRVDRHAAEFALLCVAGAGFRALRGWRPRAVRFRHRRPPSIAEHRRLFQVEPLFEQPVDAVESDIEWMDLPLSPDPLLLREAIDRQMLGFRHRVAGGDSVAERVRDVLRAGLGGPVPTREDIAARLGMSPRTLQRRLDAEGWSYSRLLDEIRRQATLERLLDPDTTIARICHEIGFATETALYRAFRRWTGRTPSDYRAAARPTSRRR